MQANYHHRFERDVLRVVILIGLMRFIVAFFIEKSSIDQFSELYIDVLTILVFLAGLVLIQSKVSDRWIVSFFFAPLIVILWISLYFNNGLASAGEINAFAVVIILTLTIQGRLPLVFIGVMLAGVSIALYTVEQKNLAAPEFLSYNTATTTLLIITLANIGMVFYAKGVFDSSRKRLKEISKNLLDRADEIRAKRRELAAQNEELLELREELEKKVDERTKELQEQKKSLERYLQLSLTELIKPYSKTTLAIRDLQNGDQDEMAKMLIESGKKLEFEVEKLRKRLLATDE